MRRLDKDLIEEEMKRVGCYYAEELELTNDYITELFKDWQVREYTDHFYDEDCPEINCFKDINCTECGLFWNYKNSKEQLSHNNWVDIWGRGYWDEPQESVDNRVKILLMKIMDDPDLEYRLWTFDDEELRLIYYYNRDRFSDNWFVFEKRGED